MHLKPVETKFNWNQGLWEGFRAMLPFWLGAIPSGIAFGVAAHGAGLGSGVAQSMSLLVFTASGQMATLSHSGFDGSLAAMVLTVVLLNAHLPLLAAHARQQTSCGRKERLVAAFVLTDGGFAVAGSRGTIRLAVLTGAGASMFLAWNLGTALGLIFGQALPKAMMEGFSLAVPLTFVALLVPRLRTSSGAMTALTAGAAAWVCAQVSPVGLALVCAAMVGAACHGMTVKHE